MCPSTSAVESKYWALFIVCLLSNILAGQISTLMSVFLPTVLNSLLQNAPSDETAFNQISASINAIYLLGWTIGGFTWGLIGDKIGRAKSLAFSIGMSGLLTVLVSYATSWEMILLLRLFAGFGVGGVMVISVTFLSEVWPEPTRNIIIGIVSIGFPVGIFSSGVVNYVSDWRQGFMMGLIPMLLGVFIYFTIKESKAWIVSNLHPPAKTIMQLFVENRDELIHGTLIFGSMLIGLWAVFSWFPTWVQSLLAGAGGQNERSITMMLLGIGGVTGGFFSGWIAKTFGVRNSMMFCFSGCFMLAVLLFGLNTSFSSIIYLETALLSIFFGISQGLLSFYIPQLFPISIRAGATGFCFNLGRIFTTIAVFSLGTLVNILGGFGNALLTFSFVFIFGFIVLYFSKNYKKEKITVVG